MSFPAQNAVELCRIIDTIPFSSGSYIEHDQALQTVKLTLKERVDANFRLNPLREKLGFEVFLRQSLCKQGRFFEDMRWIRQTLSSDYNSNDLTGRPN